MPNRPRPQAFEQAFLLGESTVLLFYHAEHRWFHATNFAPRLPEIIEVRVDQLRDLIHRLQRVFRSRSRPRICEQFVVKLDEASEYYRSAWGDEIHRAAINAFNNADLEAGTDVYPQLLREAPVMGDAWRALNVAANLFIDALPANLRRLARLAELISVGLWYSRAYPESQQERRLTTQGCLSVELNDQLNTAMQGLWRRFAPVRSLTCDLYGLKTIEVVSKLSQFRSQILLALECHARESDPARETQAAQANVRRPSLRPSHALALQSYRWAVQEMSRSGCSLRMTRRVAWDWLHENGSGEYQLPTFPNWERYVREAERFYRRYPDQHSSGEPGRSIVRFSDADVQRRR